jgi:DNA-directed RNA polymerase specialized sigma24 family protein
MLVKLSTDVGLHGVQLVTAYAVATVIAAVVTWWAENAVAARHNPPPEAEMTKEQWDKLTPRQRIIVRRRLQDKKSVKEVADELQMSVAEVNEELCRALQSIVS